MPPPTPSSRVRVDTENFSKAKELEQEKNFVRNMFGNSLSSWKYGEVDKIDGTKGLMAASFAAKSGTYILFNSAEVHVKPRLHRRDILKQTYVKAVGEELNTLKLFVGYKVINKATVTCFKNASNVIYNNQKATIDHLDAVRWNQLGRLDENQEVQRREAEKGVLGYWLSVREGELGWDEMADSNYYLNTFKKALGTDDLTKNRYRISMVEWCWSLDQTGGGRVYEDYDLSIRVHVEYR
ncbi:hypothetical protein SLS62_004382 [Diatrype stigma]|uniref:Uncharacterized protein n=1 Tax=Diatrype stigma TaxID=117547 RepID=A0AAN9UV44_9PEZI